MSFKILFGDKVSAVRYKEHILSVLNEHKSITVTEVSMDVCMKFGEPEDDFRGWTTEHIPEIRKARVREIKDGFGLYLPDPVKIVSEQKLTINKESAARMQINPTEIVFENTMSDKEQIDYLINSMSKLIVGKQKAMAHHKLNKKTVIERPCWFHKWTQNIVVRDGEIICQDLAICEFPEDGHVERITWDHIRFVEEWE